MPDLFSYRLEHFLPFSQEVYDRLFTVHNEAVWPAQIVAILLVVGIGWSAWKGWGRATPALLAPLWFFVGWAFFIERYADLIWVAPYIGAAFVMQGVLLMIIAAGGWLKPPKDGSGPKLVGRALAFFAVVVHPMVAPLLGRAWSGLEIVGIAPDPTALFTLGLIVAARKVRWVLLAVPLAWCVFAGLTAAAMDDPTGFVTLFMGAVALLIAIVRTARGD